VNCDSMLVMFRAQAILAVIALLAAPVALLARGIVCDPANCTCAFACAHPVSRSQPMCGAVKHAPTCGTHQGHHAIDYGLIVPIAPTAPLPYAQFAAPALSPEFVLEYQQSPIAGFSAVPFEPPRS